MSNRARLLSRPGMVVVAAADVAAAFVATAVVVDGSEEDASSWLLRSLFR